MKKVRIVVLLSVAFALAVCFIALMKTAVENRIKTAARDANTGVGSTEIPATQTEKEQIMSIRNDQDVDDQDIVVETSPEIGAFWNALRRQEALQKRALTSKEIRLLARKHAGGNPDAETYFFLDAEWKLKEKPRRFISSDKYRLWLEAKKNLYGLDESESADLLDIYLADQYASDTEKIAHHTKPIGDWGRWIKENAPSEWEVVDEAYSDNQWKFLDTEPGAVDGPPRFTYDNFPTLEQRVRAYYTAFFEAVALLPDDAAAFTVYFGSASPVPASEERRKIENANPRQDALPPPEERPTAPDEAVAAEAAFEQAIQDSIRQYGPEEGLRRLIMSDQDWIEQIVRSRERRQSAPPSPPSEDSQP